MEWHHPVGSYSVSSLSASITSLSLALGALDVATFITTVLDNGCSLEGVRRAAGHAVPPITKLYDRRGHDPEESASFFANY